MPSVTSAVDLTVDVSDAAGLDEPAHIALTVHLPDPQALAEPSGPERGPHAGVSPPDVACGWTVVTSRAGVASRFFHAV